MLTLLTPRQSDAVGGPIGSMREAKTVASYPNYDAAYLAKRLGASNPKTLEHNRYRTGGQFTNAQNELVYLQNATKGYEAEAEECLKKEFKDWLTGVHEDNYNPQAYDNMKGGAIRRDMRGHQLDGWKPTWWGPHQLTYLPGVREYLREQAILTDKNSLDMNKLAHLGPQNVEEAWAYFKHWVKGRPVGPEECLRSSQLEPNDTSRPFRAGPIHMQHQTMYSANTPYQPPPTPLTQQAVGVAAQAASAVASGARTVVGALPAVAAAGVAGAVTATQLTANVAQTAAAVAQTGAAAVQIGAVATGAVAAAAPVVYNMLPSAAALNDYYGNVVNRVLGPPPPPTPRIFSMAEPAAQPAPAVLAAQPQPPTGLSDGVVGGLARPPPPPPPTFVQQQPPAAVQPGAVPPPTSAAARILARRSGASPEIRAPQAPPAVMTPRLPAPPTAANWDVPEEQWEVAVTNPINTPVPPRPPDPPPPPASSRSSASSVRTPPFLETDASTPYAIPVDIGVFSQPRERVRGVDGRLQANPEFDSRWVTRRPSPMGPPTTPPPPDAVWRRDMVRSGSASGSSPPITVGQARSLWEQRIALEQAQARAA